MNGLKSTKSEKRLLSWKQQAFIVIEVKKQYKATTSAVCENTSGRWQRCNDFSILRLYYKTVADYFVNIYDVYVVNPLKIHEYAKSHFTRTKTDKADAQLIADYGKRHL